jgi:hypothetical protein
MPNKNGSNIKTTQNEDTSLKKSPRRVHSLIENQSNSNATQSVGKKGKRVRSKKTNPSQQSVGKKGEHNSLSSSKKTISTQQYEYEG